MKLSMSCAAILTSKNYLWKRFCKQYQNFKFSTSERMKVYDKNVATIQYPATDVDIPLWTDVISKKLLLYCCFDYSFVQIFLVTRFLLVERNY